MARVRNNWNVIPHLDQTEFDQFSQMVWVDRQQRPLCLDVSKCPNQIYRSKGINPRYAAHWVFISITSSDTPQKRPQDAAGALEPSLGVCQPVDGE